MPAILRIFLYQTDASLSVLGQCGSYDQGASRFRSMGICNTMPFRPYGKYMRTSQFTVMHDAMITMRYRPM